MNFQRSACIETLYTELPFLERFRAAKDDGFEFVEFWSWTDKDLAAVSAAAMPPASAFPVSTGTRSCPSSTLPRKRLTGPFCGVLWTPL